MEINQENYKEIEEFIFSEESPVGIDAKKTHILIIQKLIEIEKRLNALEKINKQILTFISNFEHFLKEPHSIYNLIQEISSYFP